MNLEKATKKQLIIWMKKKDEIIFAQKCIIDERDATIKGCDTTNIWQGDVIKRQDEELASHKKAAIIYRDGIAEKDQEISEVKGVLEVTAQLLQDTTDLVKEKDERINKLRELLSEASNMAQIRNDTVFQLSEFILTLKMS